MHIYCRFDHSRFISVLRTNESPADGHDPNGSEGQDRSRSECLAKRYEDAAKELREKVQEHKKQLEEYEYHSYLYGKQAQNLQAHCRGLIRFYEQAAEANTSMAKSHRQLADEARQNR